MPNYYVDDGGDGSDGSTWAKAYTSLSALDDAVALASGDIVYIGHNHVCQYTHSANRTITGPTSGLPCLIVSATQGSSPVTYQRSATDQIDTSESTYSLTFDGSFACFGIQMKSGANIAFASDQNEVSYGYECTFKPGHNSTLTCGGNFSGATFQQCTIDCSGDTGSASAVIMSSPYQAKVELIGCAITSATNRTGAVFTSGALIDASGCDFTGLSNATTCELIQGSGPVILTNCLTNATWAPYTVNYVGGDVLVTSTGPAADPTYCFKGSYYGNFASSTAIYRSGGAAIAGTACAWLVTTTADCGPATAVRSPWIYGTVGSAGSKTFDLYITNDTADFTDAEVWLEIQYLKDSAEAQWTWLTDQRASITATAAAQTDDTASTWNGTGPSFTYKQKLSVTATIGETGQYRARAAVGVASIASSRYFYVDNDITVT